MGRYQKYREAVGREREFREEQKKLHRKHEEVDQDTVIVEKTNMLKFLLAYFRGIVKSAYRFVVYPITLAYCCP